MAFLPILLYGFIQLRSPASSNKHKCPFGDESLYGRESDPTAATGDNGGFPF
jgi:hypothetical protein